MNVAGIVVEYNPFHNGHYYHVQKTREVTKADAVVAIMSGNYLQRGEFALISKWLRTKMALENGVDLVIELPYVYSTQHSDVFAFGSVALLDTIGASTICFGSEHGNTDAFYYCLEEIEKQSSAWKEALQASLDSGNSYAKSLSIASSSITTLPKEFLSSPNNILGLAYMSAIKKLQSTMKAATITRKKADYHDKEFIDASISSATAIRHALFEKKQSIDDLQAFVPKSTYETLKSYAANNGQFHQWEDYFHLLQFEITRSSHDDLRRIYEMEEGLEYRLKKYITKAKNFHEFMTLIKTKRYTWTRLQRLLLHIITNVKKEVMKEASQNRPDYIRPLGFTKTGQEILKNGKKEWNIPIVYNLHNSSSQIAKIQAHVDQIYSLPYINEKDHILLKNEKTNTPIIML